MNHKPFLAMMCALLGLITGTLIGIALNLKSLADNYRAVHAQELKAAAEKEKP